MENRPDFRRKHCRKLSRPFGFCRMLHGPLVRASLRLRGISTKLTTKLRTKFGDLLSLSALPTFVVSLIRFIRADKNSTCLTDPDGLLY